MPFPPDRHQLRQFYFQTWNKTRQGHPLEPMETVVAQVIQLHPEYHKLLEDQDKALDQDFPPQLGKTNPFLHMGLHVALQEQLQAGQPAGINDIYRSLAAKSESPHEAEHRMMDCLAETLWQAQRDGTMPDEGGYIACLRRLIE